MVQEPKPFEEAIVDALTESDSSEALVLLWLILRTKIPKDHDQILAAVEQYAHRWGNDNPPIVRVRAHLARERERALIDEARKEAETIKRINQRPKSDIRGSDPDDVGLRSTSIF